MKIAYIVETYTEGLGYIDNVLPKWLAKQNNKVDVITAGLPAYYQHKEQSVVDADLIIGTKIMDKVTVHTVPTIKIANRILFRKLRSLLSQLKPDVVIVRGLASPVLAQVIISKLTLKYNIITSTGLAYSAINDQLSSTSLFNWKKAIHFISRKVPGYLFSLFIKKCIASTDDCAKAAIEFYGVPKSKTKVISLGVDTSMFSPALGLELVQSRLALRKEMGFEKNDLICIWTGRITKQKGVEILAEAVEQLNRDDPSIKALFIGSGSHRHILDNYTASTVIDFLPWDELPAYYRLADVAVWPKSLTTSTLDAAACGLPVIMSNRESAVERWNGFGSDYVEGDIESLKKTILKFSNSQLRERTKFVAHKIMDDNFSWQVIASKFYQEISE
ncbi:glycosyltransferase family 4 protein [Kangiella sp.]|uniref:glycosyltransferase family 4 protein n=1 Tax=Kangiella sp. TaxID=1920245 RepID=UPI0019BD3FEE|nr:glycosyltransferase family 4 protein [Kangiella sp.]MBD3652397.1 glycosyltransferase family 4 protein [Kangiella sp.]